VKRTTLSGLLSHRENYRRDGKTVVWTNGCFDLLHPGHAASLAAAKALGDVLVVGLNSDASVKANKGPTRPILNQNDRAAMLSALAAVDHVHTKGEEYKPPHGRPVPEAATVLAYGGRIEYLPLVPGISTTELIRRIAAAHAARAM
jgi:cytidyltransferase-like protein